MVAENEQVPAKVCGQPEGTDRGTVVCEDHGFSGSSSLWLDRGNIVSLLCINIFQIEYEPRCSPFYVEQSRIIASHLPCRLVSIMQVKSTSFSPVTALIGEVIPAASQCAKETLKSPSCG